LDLLSFKFVDFELRARIIAIFKYIVSVRNKIERGQKMVKRIMVTLDDAQYEILQGLKGFGSKDAEIIRNIVIAYLSEKSYLKKASEKE